MRRTAGYAMGKARAMVGDPRGSYATNDRLIPLLNQAQDEMIINVFRNEMVSGIEAFVTVPNVPSGTTSLGQHLLAGGDLEGLISLISMRERPAGQDVDAWTPMTGVMGDMPIRKQESLNIVFKWTGSDIIFIGATQALDLRVYGQFAAFQLVNEDTPLIPSSEAVIAVRAAALLSQGRGNERLAVSLESRARDLEDELFNTLVREKQNIDVHQAPNPGYPFEPLYI